MTLLHKDLEGRLDEIERILNATGTWKTVNTVVKTSGLFKGEDKLVLTPKGRAALTHLIEAYTEDRVLEAKAKLAKSILVFGGDLPPHTKEYLQSLEQLKSKKDKV
jgi:hypothetical protein